MVIPLFPQVIELGNIVGRGDTVYLLVESAQRTFTGKGFKSYGLVSLHNNKYTELGISLESLTKICKQAKLEKRADSLRDYIYQIDGLEEELFL